MQGRRVPITKMNFDLHDEGTFMAQCGRWHKMEKKLVDIQNGGPDLFFGVSEAAMIHDEDKRAFALRVREFGGHCNVRSKTRFL